MVGGRATLPSWDPNGQCFVCGKYLADHPVCKPEPKKEPKGKGKKGKNNGSEKEPHTKEERPNERSTRKHEEKKNLEEEEEGHPALCPIPSHSPHIFCDPKKLWYSWHRGRNELYKKLAQTQREDNQRAVQLAEERVHNDKWNALKRREERELRHKKWLWQQPYGEYHGEYQ